VVGIAVGADHQFYIADIPLQEFVNITENIFLATSGGIDNQQAVAIFNHITINVPTFDLMDFHPMLSTSRYRL